MINMPKSIFFIKKVLLFVQLSSVQVFPNSTYFHTVFDNGNQRQIKIALPNARSMKNEVKLMINVPKLIFFSKQVLHFVQLSSVQVFPNSSNFHTVFDHGNQCQIKSALPNARSMKNEDELMIRVHKSLHFYQKGMHCVQLLSLQEFPKSSNF